VLRRVIAAHLLVVTRRNCEYRLANCGRLLRSADVTPSVGLAEGPLGGLRGEKGVLGRVGSRTCAHDTVRVIVGHRNDGLVGLGRAHADDALGAVVVEGLVVGRKVVLRQTVVGVGLVGEG
jgi:hypothetical protein